jgi:hypothetical protein
VAALTISLLSWMSIFPLPLTARAGVLMTRLKLPSLASSSFPPVTVTPDVVVRSCVNCSVPAWTDSKRH